MTAIRAISPAMSIAARYLLQAGSSRFLLRTDASEIEVESDGMAYVLMGGIRVVKADTLDALLATIRARSSDLRALDVASRTRVRRVVHAAKPRPSPNP
jgi:hypothetical protein